jgi:hypothetical protein
MPTTNARLGPSDDRRCAERIRTYDCRRCAERIRTYLTALSCGPYTVFYNLHVHQLANPLPCAEVVDATTGEMHAATTDSRAPGLGSPYRNWVRLPGFLFEEN